MNNNNDFRTDNKSVAKQNTPNAPVNTNPIKQVVDVMKKVDLKSPDAAKNEKSIVDKNGKRIKLDDEEVRYNHFKGRFVRKNPATGEEENIK